MLMHAEIWGWRCRLEDVELEMQGQRVASACLENWLVKARYCSDMCKSTPYPLPEALALQAKFLMPLQKRGMCPADKCRRRFADSRKIAVCTLYFWKVGVKTSVAVLVRQTDRTLHISTTV